MILTFFKSKLIKYRVALCIFINGITRTDDDTMFAGLTLKKRNKVKQDLDLKRLSCRNVLFTEMIMTDL